MAKAVNYDKNHTYAATNNKGFTPVLKSNGTVDFDQAPAGYAFRAMPVETWDNVRWMNLDPRFVTKHLLGSKNVLCYMELTELSIGNPEQVYKSECNKEQRQRRCRIISEKTGQEIMCPYDAEHRCETCQRKEKDQKTSESITFSALSHIDDDGEEVEFDAPADTNIEVDINIKISREMVFSELEQLDALWSKNGKQPKHVRIYKMWCDGYTATDIKDELNIPKATLNGDMKRIATIVKKYF
ncbi:MAG: hypothetical protein U0L31_00190 [Bifidobacteriaceae bacterium]|nr:hypothetical protein [Bifidobacteriaceae bacterium]